MKDYSTGQIRNVALAGHSGSGKTSLMEAIALNTKLIDRMGRTEDGSTVSDYDAEEAKRGVSINTSLVPVEHKGCKINFLDTPGVRDFVGEIRNSMRVVDAVVIVLDATGGVEVGTELAWEYAQEFKLPVLFVINKVNRERANFDRVLGELKDAFGIHPVLLNFPHGEALDFKGCVNLLQMKMSIPAGAGKMEYADIPAECADRAAELKNALVEAAAEGDDSLTEKFLDGTELTDDEVLKGLEEVVQQHRAYPILATAATEGVGVNSLLDFVIQCVPPPSEGHAFAAKRGDEEVEFRCDENAKPVAFVFKTISDPFAGHLTFFKVLDGTVSNDSILLNTRRGAEERINHLMTMRGKKQDPVTKVAAGDIGVLAKLNATHTNDTLCDPKDNVVVAPTPMPPHTVTMSVKAKNKDDEEKIGIAMHRLVEQDPTLKIHRDPVIKQTILSGMGDTHLDVAVSRLKAQSKVEVELEVPRVAYRETITKKAEGQGKHKKQSGGRGQFGDCWIRLEPQPEGAGFEFVWEIVGGVIPTKFQPSVEKGVVQAMERGIIAGYQAVDIKATCYFGSYHSVDSSDMAFQVAASKGFKLVSKNANPIILEPIHKVRVIVPEQYMGDVMGDMNSKRGRILGMNSEGRKQVVEALVPLAEMFTYSRELRSMTQGRGTFEMEYDHYERVPPEVQAKIVAAAKPEAEEED